MAAPPPPGAAEEEPQDCEGELLDCQEERCLRFDEVQRRIHERVHRSAGRRDQPQPELADPTSSSFQRGLYRHLQRMPPRYLADVDADDKAEDVLLHWRILDECADPDKRPVFHARHAKSIMVSGEEPELDKPFQRLMTEGLSLEPRAVGDNDSRIASSRVIHLHEIIFCSIDKPKLLSQLSAVLDEVKLHVRECHLYCTVDGFCLALFLVEGWEAKETHGLTLTLKIIASRPYTAL